MATLKALCGRVRSEATYGARMPWDKQSDWQRGANGWTVRLRFRGRRMTVDFWMGSACAGEPDAPSVLECLLSDASCADQSFEDWCQEYGYNADSRRDHSLYQQCRSQTRRLRQFLAEDFDAFMDAER